ncbi:unnamed protein product [Psylliodes chrysocephalus]|uniref:Zinc finger MYM-type 1-like n=1 Tax=Psylliodes chrysocephalus TaxID=3402493 RepID=A0A9P0CM29_9CUCU|nr:unnamed protein product [Psylliodes chrysocephala]
MAGTYNGVQARITKRNGLAEFVPCLTHSLNLVGVHFPSSCQEAINLFRLIQKVFCFFVGSTTRLDTMKKFVKTNLKGSSQTRWSAEHVAVKTLLNNLPEVVESLEELKQTSHAPEAKYEAARYNPCAFRLFNGWPDENFTKNEIEYWIEEAKEVAGKIGVEPILPNKQIPRCKKQFDEMCDDESRTLQPVKHFSQATMMVFDRILSEIKKKVVDSVITMNSNFAFLNGIEILNLSNEELQKHGTDLGRKYERDLNAVEFCQELYVFKEQGPLSFKDIKNASAFNLLQQIYTHDLQDTFPNICIALRIYCTLPILHPQAASDVLANLNLSKIIYDLR